MVERAIRDGDPRELVFSRWALEEPTPDLQGKTGKIVGQLGQVVEDITDLPVDKKPPVFDMKKAVSEVKQELSKTLPQDVTEKKGFSPRVVSIAQALMAQDILETFPNKRLFEIIDGILGDDTLNYTFSQYYMNYQDRLKITSLAKLKEWDTEHPRYNFGNVTPIQYLLMRQYEALKTKAEKTQFRKDHPEMDSKPQTEWLKSHPKENAQLAIWGQAKILSLEAYKEAQRLIKELDIPDAALPDLTLPPEKSIENYFKYQEQGEELGYNSSEVQLLIAKDDDLRKFLNREEIDTPIASLELKVKHRALFDLRDSYSDKDSLAYLDDKVKDAEGLTARDRAQAKLKADNPEWVDDTRRIEAIENQADALIIEAWVERGRLIDEFDAGSSKAKVWLIDNPDVHKWALEQKLLTDDGSDWNVPVLRINVEWQEQDEEYQAILDKYPGVPTEQRDDIKAFLAKPENAEYAIARIQRDGYNLGFKDVTKWTAFYQLPAYGFWRERYRMNNPDFDTEVKVLRKAKGEKLWADIDPTKIPAAAYDEIYEKYKALFDQYEDVQGTPKQRDKARERIFAENPAFKEAYYRRKAYELLFDEKYVENYATLMLIPKKGYADSRYLKAHQDFYFYAKKKLGWIAPDPEWEKIPSEEVEKLYDEYTDMQERKVGQAKLDEFREKHLDLDAWGVLKFGWTSILDKKRRAGMTAKEKFEETRAKADIEWDKAMEELWKQLEALEVSQQR